jgi:glutaredoxin
MPRIAKILLLCSVVIFSNTASSGSIQKWVDAQGKIHYGSAPPQGAQLQKLDAAMSIAGSSVTSGPELILYSTSKCGYCKKARAYMRKNDIAFTDYDIEKDRFANSEFKRLGGRGVPLLVRGEKTLTGFGPSSYKRFFAQ